MFKHILIATDGSAVSHKAAKAGITLAGTLGAKVTAYYAVEDLRPIYVEGYTFDQQMIDRFETDAREAGQKRVDAIGKMAKDGPRALYFGLNEGLHALRGHHQRREKTQVRRHLHGLTRSPRLFETHDGQRYAESVDAHEAAGRGLPLSRGRRRIRERILS